MTTIKEPQHTIVAITNLYVCKLTHRPQQSDSYAKLEGKIRITILTMN
jgi:hypothetical protein